MVLHLVFDFFKEYFIIKNTTARYWASINHHRNIEKYLIDHGALDPDAEYKMILKHLDKHKDVFL